MPLRPLLAHLVDDPQATALARDGGRAFVSQSLRPYLVAALLDGAAAPTDRPALVVAGDDRQARDLAADLRAWLAPRPVRFYPSRGVTYESHLAPPPHLVGLRVAALDALLADRQPAADAPVVVVSAVALSEKVPDPALRPHSFALRVGELLDLDEVGADLVAAGYERVDQVEDRGQFAIRGGILDVYPATEERAVRVDLFDIEIESLRWFSTFTQRSLGEAEAVEIAPAAELAAEHRELAEIAALEDADKRPDIAELLPVDRFHAFFDLAPPDATVIVAAEEEIAPALTDHWQDVCAAFHDTDAHHLYVPPDAIRAALDGRARISLSSISSDQPIEFRAQALARRGRTRAREARAVRLPNRHLVAAPRRGRAHRVQPRSPARPLAGR
jgi:transcription-repair coupling factor (superfamily II helicase)